jgi:hypothetical protein
MTDWGGGGGVPHFNLMLSVRNLGDGDWQLFVSGSLAALIHPPPTPTQLSGFSYVLGIVHCMLSLCTLEGLCHSWAGGGGQDIMCINQGLQ